MFRYVWYSSLIVTALACSDRKTTDTQDKARSQDSAMIGVDLEEKLRTLLKDPANAAPAAVVTVVKGNAVGYFTETNPGLKDLTQNPVDSSTKFMIGSVTKGFTGLLATQVEKDGLSLTRPIRDQFCKPDFCPFQLENAEDNAIVSMHHLLSHQSGVARHDLLFDDLGQAPRKEVVSTIKYLTRSQPVGTGAHYNNFMYAAAGYLLGEFHDSSWEALIQTRFLDALGMHQTGFVHKAEEGYATPFVFESDRWSAIAPPDITGLGPAGSITASAHDMGLWLRFLLETTRGDDEAMQKAFRPHNSFGADQSYGYGFVLSKYKGLDLIWHQGAIAGASSILILVPQHDLAVSVMANNQASSYPYRAAFEVIHHMLGLGAVEIPENPASPSMQILPLDWIEQQAGEYSHPVIGSLTFASEAGQPKANYNGEELTLSLVRIPAADLYVLNDEFFLEFLRDNNGNVAAVAVCIDVTEISPVKPVLLVKAGSSKENLAPGQLQSCPSYFASDFTVETVRN